MKNWYLILFFKYKQNEQNIKIKFFFKRQI